ncbi:MAG: hypothetical protein ACRDS0_27930, partial [Pseudonocardiaceae bacterium]
MLATRVAVLLERYQPGRALRSIEASAGLPAASLAGWVDRTASRGPTAPASVDMIRRVAEAIGAPPSVVSDFPEPLGHSHGVAEFDTMA